MLKKWMNNYYFLAGMLIIIQYILALLIGLILDYFSIEVGIGTPVLVLSTWYVGEFYARTYNQEMPKELRKSVTIIVVVFSLIISIITYALLLKSNNPPEPVIAYFLLFMNALGLILTFFIVYWLLGFSGRVYLKYYHKKVKKEY